MRDWWDITALFWTSLMRNLGGDISCCLIPHGTDWGYNEHQKQFDHSQCEKQFFTPLHPAPHLGTSMEKISFLGAYYTISITIAVNVPTKVSHEGFSKMSSYIPPIPHDRLPSCITSNWWGLSSIELKVRTVALWNRMIHPVQNFDIQRQYSFIFA